MARIVTIAELLEENKRLAMPTSLEGLKTAKAVQETGQVLLFDE